MEEAKGWLAEKGVPDMFERGIQALVTTKPENVAQFLSTFYAQEAEREHRAAAAADDGLQPTTSSNASNHALATGDGSDSSLPSTPGEFSSDEEPMNGACLAALLKDGSTDIVTVIDVREHQKGGRIKQSEWVPASSMSDVLAKKADVWQKIYAVVFVSSVAPDDDACAALFRRHIKDACQRSGAKPPSVYVLAGGLDKWLTQYGTDERLVVDYDAGAFGLSRIKSAKALKSLRVAVPEAPNQMTCSTLSVILLEDHEDCVIVDVRLSQEGGHIPGSRHVAHEDLTENLARYAEELRNKNAVVFVSYLSPDVDQTCAVQLMGALAELRSPTTVFILYGGLKKWFGTYASNPKLVEGYSPEVLCLKRRSVLSSSLSPTDLDRKSPSHKHIWESRRLSEGGVKMVIDVPDAPGKMGQVELATLLKGSQSSPKRGMVRKSLIVDVRDTTKGGHIVDSTHIPAAECVETMKDRAAEWHDLATLIFVSVFSPDLDETVAIEAMKELRERGSSANVFILIDGAKGFFSAYEHSGLVEQYEPDYWGFKRTNESKQTSPNRMSSFRKSTPLGITVPEAPLFLPPQELQLLVKSKSDAVVVADVRPAQEGGVVPGSLHTPHHLITARPADFAAKWQHKDVIVFASSQQGDLDISVASPIIAALRELNSRAQVCVSLPLGGKRGRGKQT